MGVRTAMVVIAEGVAATGLRAGLTPDASGERAFAAEFFPGRVGEAIGARELGEVLHPDEGVVYAGLFPGGGALFCQEFWHQALGGDLSARIARIAAGRDAYLHLLHSVAELFAFTHWSAGAPVRSLLVSTQDDTVMETGERYDFELPYWSDDDGIASKLDIGELALSELFGFGVAGDPDNGSIDPLEALITGFRLERAETR